MRQASLVLAVLVCGSVARAESLTRPPKLKTFVEAEYPPERKAAGTTAHVVLTIDVAADGRVENVTVAESGGADFDRAALAAARQFVFDPGEVDGKPAPVRLTYRYDFVIRTELVPLGPQVNFEGTVIDRLTRRPLGGITVRLVDLSRETVTDALGRFSFVAVGPGEHPIDLLGPNLITVGTSERFEPGQKRTVTYQAEPRTLDVDEEEVLRAPRLRKESVVTSLRAEEARRVPGTQGDTLKVVQNLPGVARSSSGSGELVVWGAAPRDTRVIIDGVEIPALYHIGGLRSTVNSDLVASVALLPGAYGAEYGRALGGLVRVETRALQTAGVHGYLAADLLDASAMLSVAAGKKLRLAASARYSYLDKILEGVVSPDVGDFFPLPRYDDYQFKATLALREGEELSATVLASDDHIRRIQPSNDPAGVRSDATDQSFYRAFLRYSRLLDDGSSFSLTPFFAYDTQRRTTAFGQVPTLLANDSYGYGLRAGWRGKLHARVTGVVGLDLLGTQSMVERSGSLTLPPREGDITVFGQPPGADVAHDSWSTHVADFAPHFSTEIRAGRVTLTAGLRFDVFILDGNRSAPRKPTEPQLGFTRFEWSLDPRLALSVRAHQRVTLDLAAGLYHQAPVPEDMSAVFGNPTLGLERGAHVTAGAKVRITGTLSAEVTGYYKYLWQLAMRNDLPTPPLARVLVQDGVGQVYGLQLLVRQELWKNLFGWITYSVSRSERRNHPDSEWRLSDFDQTHVLGVVASYEYRGWGFGVRLRYATGFPRTPVDSAFADGASGRYQPIFGEQNSIRIPDFVQLDARIEKTFVWPRVSLHLYLDVQNLTYQRNPEEIVYNHDFTRRDYITGLPTLAVAGARLSF